MQSFDKREFFAKAHYFYNIAETQPLFCFFVLFTVQIVKNLAKIVSLGLDPGTAEFR